MKILSNINDFNEANYFEELPFYNKPIEKPKINLLAEEPFYEQLNNKNKSNVWRVCNVVQS